MSQLSPTPEHIRTQLTQDQQAVDELRDLLVQERELLEQREHQALPALIERKNHLQTLLAHNGQCRQQWLANSGHSQWQQYLAQRADTQALVQPWQALAEAFSECQRLNDINGKLISRSRQTLGQLLNLVRGQHPAPGLYTPSGTPSQTQSSQSVTKV